MTESIKRLRTRKLRGRHDPRCRYCRRSINHRTATLDHVVPLSRGGETSDRNTVLACGHCNSRKGDAPAGAFHRTVVKVRRPPKRLPYEPLADYQERVRAFTAQAIQDVERRLQDRNAAREVEFG